MKISTTLKYLALSLTSAVLALIVVCLFGAYNERKKAESALATLQQIQVGSTNSTIVLQMISPYRSYLQDSMKDDPPQLELNFQNRWLRVLALAPHVEFRILITFRDGVVVEKKAWELDSASGCVASVTERDRAYETPFGGATDKHPNHMVYGGGFFSKDVPLAPTALRHIRIEDDSTYPLNMRREDWKFNLSGLTRIGRDCRDARTILPNAVLCPQCATGSRP